MIVTSKDKIVPVDSGYLKVGMTDGTRTIMGTNGIKGGYCKIIMHCNICQEDDEMFGGGYFEVTRKNAKSFKGCGCNGKFSAEQKLVLAKRVIEKEGYTFKGVIDNGTVLSTSTYLKLKCPEGHEYESTTLSKFLDVGRRCPHCAGNIAWSPEKFKEKAREVHNGLYEYGDTKKIINSKSKFEVICKKHGSWYTDVHHHINRKQGCPHPECCWTKISEVKASNTEEFITKALNVHGDKYDYSLTNYHRTFTKVEIICNGCKSTFKQTASDHLSGNGCPYCAGDNQKQLYIFQVLDNGVPIAVKSGIAVNFKTRIGRQNRLSCYDVNLLKLYTFDEVTDCKAAEKECKSVLERGILTKSEYPDGYMETYSVRDIDNIQQIVFKHKGVDSGL